MYNHRNTSLMSSGLFLLLVCCSILCVRAFDDNLDRKVTATKGGSLAVEQSPYYVNSLLRDEHQNTGSREKRSFLLKKKILGAGLLGFGLGVVKGYHKAEYQHRGTPDVHHVYVAAPPPVKYVEYVEKPVYIERIVERPIFNKHAPSEYEPSWPPVRSAGEPSSAYGYK